MYTTAGSANTITLNTLGLSDINKTGTTYICQREYNYDYLNVQPGGGGTFGGTCRSADYGSGNVPYLDLVLSSIGGAIINQNCDGFTFNVG